MESCEYCGFSFQKFDLMKGVLSGSQASGGRFGTAISSLGDINFDNYNGKLRFVKKRPSKLSEYSNLQGI